MAMTARALVRRPTSAGQARPERRPSLVEVPRRRRTARVVVLGVVVLALLMVGAVVVQTYVARLQLTVDGLDRGIRSAHEEYDVLRRERAELRAPGRLAEQAALLGMVPADQTEFVQFDATVIGAVQRTGLTPTVHGEITADDVFGGYARVKAQTGGAP